MTRPAFAIAACDGAPSVQGKAQGFTHCFFLTFATIADRDAYLPHPAHKEFGATLRPHLDKVLVVDYVAKD